ncbi:GNAT family N-acetyltransferase [Raineyella fluvialis]|uniref:GNAT family N-acetyltransferase n=1 Tax=Raineyella fluvialis TaxID=2662261 RepID=A0A5Q2FGB0_9ACTN|nr:GNAT family protein [Raineyella fluvialis]QGF23725.1 GNAT family N-acetyltransferase [Raineyella fluvialis]
MPSPVIRPATLEDAPVLAALYRRNRSFLQPWEPQRDDAWFTVAGQQAFLTEAQHDREAGLAVTFLILDDDEPVGRITLSRITRGAFLSGGIGYWVSLDHTGRGLATSAVAAVKAYAFGELGLHRLEAATLPHNIASQRVLLSNGFARIGRAPRYLKINGRWQDHVLFQVLAD